MSRMAQPRRSSDPRGSGSLTTDGTRGLNVDWSSNYCGDGLARSWSTLSRPSLSLRGVV